MFTVKFVCIEIDVQYKGIFVCINSLQWWFVNPGTFVPRRYFQIDEFSGLLNRPSVQERKSVPTLFFRISEISGLSEPGLTNHHCIWYVLSKFLSKPQVFSDKRFSQVSSVIPCFTYLSYFDTTPLFLSWFMRARRLASAGSPRVFETVFRVV